MEPVLRVILEDSIRQDIRPEVSVTVLTIQRWLKVFSVDVNKVLLMKKIL